MRPKTKTLTMVTADPNGICVTQTPAGAGNFTLNGALISGGILTNDVPRRLSFTSDADESGDTYTVTGTLRNGQAVTETITGPNTTTVYSDLCYDTVSQIATDGAGTGNITIGTMDSAYGAWIPLDTNAIYAFQVSLSAGANLTWSIECTITNVLSADYEYDPKVFTVMGSNVVSNDAELDGIVDDSEVVAFQKIGFPLAAARIAIKDWVAGTVTLTILEGPKEH